MAYEIIWSDDAKEDYRNIAYYLLDNHSFEVAEKFTETLFDKVKLFEKNPRIGLASRLFSSITKNDYHSSDSSLLYYWGNQITIMNLMDTRRKLNKIFNTEFIIFYEIPKTSQQILPQI